ncbi:Mediator of RNA polymerase II transcription subunit 12 [Neolecta irregularis DAH-3]|uniref:Mediator of RNA polymerase II transcription subunit 12 n=1 Tax=Neolecta irregularis (strain DAH-3) TaxID=1198029 RepID=A0A1U7LI96_NEOID|nr:Mediator of RNA polymerase II transcription subunit 12 [Neolecta irregularis DAH-3]|eukprot:OLL22251.1 Mediator of RNA polymerase II transcription subunit 12 [Neolecta irregularis DAH-3]
MATDVSDEHLSKIKENLENSLPFPQSSSLMLSSRFDPYTDGLYLIDPTNEKIYEMPCRPWDMIEESQPTLSENDGPIDLKLYNARMCSKEKPFWNNDDQTFQKRTFEAEKSLRKWEFAK